MCHLLTYSNIKYLPNPIEIFCAQTFERGYEPSTLAPGFKKALINLINTHSLLHYAHTSNVMNILRSLVLEIPICNTVLEMNGSLYKIFEF